MSKNLKPWAFTCIWVAGQGLVMEELLIEMPTFSSSVIHTGSLPSSWTRRSEFKSMSYPRGVWSSWANPRGFALPNELMDSKNTKSFKFILVCERRTWSWTGLVTQLLGRLCNTKLRVRVQLSHANFILWLFMSKVASKAKAQIVVCYILSLTFYISQLVAFVDSSRQSCANTPCGPSSWCTRGEIHGLL